MKRTTWAFLALALMVAAPARASLMFYGDRPSYDAATTGNTVIDFEGLAPDGGFQFLPTPAGITLSGVNFTIQSPDSDGFLFVIGKDFYYPGTSVLSSQQSSTDTNNIAITLPGGGFTALALDGGGFGGSTFTFLLSTGDTFTVPAPALTDLAFVGVTSSDPIVSLLITAPSSDVALNIDNFTFGYAVPEPASAALVALGALGCVLRARRRGRRVPTA